jgi:hypothetical protein
LVVRADECLTQQFQLLGGEELVCRMRSAVRHGSDSCQGLPRFRLKNWLLIVSSGWYGVIPVEWVLGIGVMSQKRRLQAIIGAIPRPGQPPTVRQASHDAKKCHSNHRPTVFDLQTRQAVC